MTLNETQSFFKDMCNSTGNKAELKIYNKFILTLSDLENKQLDASHMHAIEQQLTALKLRSNPNKRKAYYKKALLKFNKFLRESFNLIAEGHYTAIGMCIGVCFGSVMGTTSFMTMESTNSISYGTSLGLIIGFFIGNYLDAKALKEGRVIQIKKQ